MKQRMQYQPTGKYKPVVFCMDKGIRPRRNTHKRRIGSN